jgi:hypothetical protein
VKQQHVTNRRADRPALHPCRHWQLGAGASGLVIARPARPSSHRGPDALSRFSEARLAPGICPAWRSTHVSRARS